MDSLNSQKFFLYARKSTDVEDKQVLSIEAQVTELREFVRREGFPIVEELIEKQSAKIPGRPIFNDMLERIENGEASGIISWHPDRLARNSIDGGKIIYLVDTGKIRFLKFPQFWFENTPQGKFMLNIAFGQSKYFVDSLSENTKRGLRQKVRNGEYPGKAPVGYLNDVRTKSIVIDKKTAPFIKQAFEMFDTGKYRLMDITDFLAKHGITTTGKKVLKNRISKIFNNPFYYGHFRYAGEIHEGTYEPIISRKLFEEVQNVLHKRSFPWHKVRIPKPFLGLFRCHECGMMFTGEDKTKFYRGTNRTVTYVYYRCTKKSKTRKCHQPFIRQEKLDSQLSDLLQKVSLRQDWKEKMLLKLNEEEQNISQSCREFVQKIREEIKQINVKLQFLLDSYLDQVIEKEAYITKKSDLLSQKKKLDERILSFEQTGNSWLGPMREWVNEASVAASIAKGQDLGAKKVLAQKIFGSDLWIENRMVRGEALNHWAALRAAPTSRNWEAQEGIEPSHSCFADSCVSTSPLRQF